MAVGRALNYKLGHEEYGRYIIMENKTNPSVHFYVKEKSKGGLL